MTYPNPADRPPQPTGPPPPASTPAPPASIPPGGPPAQVPPNAGEPDVARPATPTAPTGPPAGFDSKGRVRRTRISGVWIGLVAAGLILILLIIFIAQNLNDAPIHFLWLSGQVSVGLALLVGGVCGLLIAAVPASIRIWQLRKALRKNVRSSPPAA